MEDDKVDNPVAVEVTQEPAADTENQAEENATDALDPENPDSEQDNAEPLDEEIEYGGNKYKVPKELAPIIAKAESLQADYTKKTMDLAEERRSVAAEYERVRNEAQMNHEIIQDLSQLRAVETELSQYQNVNWQQWQAADEKAAAAGMARMMQLQNSYGQLRGQVEARKSEITANVAQRTATQISQAIEALGKPDPDKGWDGKFDDAKRGTLTKFGKDLGYTDEELAGTSHPLMIKTLNLARIGYESLKKQRTAAAPQKTEAKPVPQIGAGKTRSTVDPDKLPMEQWVKYERERMKKAGTG